MESDSSKLSDEVENDLLSGIIETNREMDDLLLESDFLLESAESELKATIEEKTPVASEDESKSSLALSIEVSEDIFKELNLSSSFQYTSSSSNNPDKEENNFDGGNDSEEMDEDLDRTLVAENEKSETKSVQIKPLCPLDSEEEHDYVFPEFFNTTLEITVINTEEKLETSPVKAKLKHQDYFEGCSQNFEPKNIANAFTVILQNDSCACNREIKIGDNIEEQILQEENFNSVELETENNSSNTASNEPKIDNEDYLEDSQDFEHKNIANGDNKEQILQEENFNSVGLEIENNSANSVSNEPKIDNEDDFESSSQDFEPKNIANAFTVILKNDSSNSCNREIKIGDNKEEKILQEENFNSIDLESEKNSDDEPKIDNEDLSSEKKDNEDFIESKSNWNITKDNFSVTLKILQEKTENNFVDSTSNEIKIIDNDDLSSEKKNNENFNEAEDMNVTFQNFMQTEFNCEENNEDLTDKTLTEEDINENNNETSLKRIGEEIEIKSKQMKLDITETVTTEVKKPEEVDKIATEVNKIAEVKEPEKEIEQETLYNFTQAIFDPQETTNHNDLELKDLETKEDYFKSVREQWRSLSLPNPHKSHTTRYVPENKSKITTSSKNEPGMKIDNYLQQRMQNMTNEINIRNGKLNSWCTKNERHKLNNELEHLKRLRYEVEKNQEELKHINMFYINESQGWNGSYLTKPELQEIQEQDSVLEFIKKNYKSN